MDQRSYKVQLDAVFELPFLGVFFYEIQKNYSLFLHPSFLIKSKL